MIAFLWARLTRNEKGLERFSVPKSDLMNDLAGASVAIVGNARALAETTQGPDIDAADIVIRINSAPMPNPQSHGTRTSWIALSTPIPAETLAARAPNRILWMTRKRRRISYALAQDPRFYLNRRSDWLDLATRLASPPTTGLMVIDMVAQSQAQSITLYGFDFFSSLSLSGRRSAGQVPHDFAAEKSFVEALVGSDSRVTVRAM